MRSACLLIRPREDWGEGREAWDPRIKRRVCLNRGRRRRWRRSAEERRAVEGERRGEERRRYCTKKRTNTLVLDTKGEVTKKCKIIKKVFFLSFFSLMCFILPSVSPSLCTAVFVRLEEKMYFHSHLLFVLCTAHWCLFLLIFKRLFRRFYFFFPTASRGKQNSFI